MVTKKLYGKSRTVPILKTKVDIISWLKRGKVRYFIFQNIKMKTMPSDIVTLLAGKKGRKSSSHYAQVSRAITELQIQGLIKCLNPKQKTGRLYELTKKGQEIKKEL